MGNAHPEAMHNLAIVEFHLRLDDGEFKSVKVNAYLVTFFYECSAPGCRGGTRIHFFNECSICVDEDIFTTTLKLQRARRPFYEKLAEKIRKHESN